MGTRQEPLTRMGHLALSTGNILEGTPFQKDDEVVLIRDMTYASFTDIGRVEKLTTDRAIVLVEHKRWSVPLRQVGYNPDPTNWSARQREQFAYFVSSRVGELLGSDAFTSDDPIIVVKGAVPLAWFDGTFLSFHKSHPSGLSDMATVHVRFYNRIYEEWQKRIVGASELGYPNPSQGEMTPVQTKTFNQLMQTYYDQFSS